MTPQQMTKRITIVLLLSILVTRSFAQQTISLMQALKTANELNPYLKVNALEIEASKADVVTAKLRPNPF